jgi:hypothetical protein
MLVMFVKESFEMKQWVHRLETTTTCDKKEWKDGCGLESAAYPICTYYLFPLPYIMASSTVTLATPTSKQIVYTAYRDERQLADIIALLEADLSEPYSIYTYRYFIHGWPSLCFLVSLFILKVYLLTYLRLGMKIKHLLVNKIEVILLVLSFVN